MKETYEVAYKDYLAGMKYKDIAAKYNVSISAVKSWKKRYWVAKRLQPLQPKSTRVATKKVAKKTAKKIAEKSELDEERQLFCIYYLKIHNKVKAYQKVKPNTNYASACVVASRWSKEPAVIKELSRLKQELYAEALLEPQDIVQKYIDIAFADLTDYLEFGREEVPITGALGPLTIKNPQTGKSEAVTKIINTVKFKESAFVDGSLLSEIRQGKDGASIKLADRLKALDWLSKHMNLATDEQKARVDLIRAQTKKITINDEQTDIEDDGFLEALNSTALEDWENED